MKKKILNFAMALCLILSSMFMLSACSEKEASSNTYQITIINGLQGGKILPDIETDAKSVQVEEGDNYSVMIIPDYGYRVAGLLIDGQIIEKDSNETIVYTFENILKDHSIAGVFEQIEQIKLVPTIKSMKLEGFKITYDSTAEGNNTLGSLVVKQIFKQNNGYDFIYNSEPININNVIERNSGTVENDIRFYKFSEADIANNVVFFDEYASLSIYCSTAQRGTWGGELEEAINIKSSDLHKIESSIYEDMYSYTIKNSTRDNIKSVELIFTVVEWKTK